MTSPQKSTERAQATRRSTGPRTTRGKARSKLNGWRHGLAAARLATTGTVDRDVERLASAIAGPNPDACRWHFAIMAAEVELELRRVRTARLERFGSTIAAGSSAPNAEHEQNLAIVLPDLIRFDRHEPRALSRRNKALKLP
jgi:hypothetical protein